MQTYRAPVRDMQFVLHEVLGAEEQFRSLPGQEEVTAELVDTVLEEAAKVFEEAVFPTNVVGHREGCKRQPDGSVKTPTGFREAYQALVDGGWLSLACDPRWGGQGLPETLNLFIDEMFCSANMSLSLWAVLTHGAYNALQAHGDEALKETWLPNMVSGRWTGTMCLTEPHAGTDLGLLRTRAEPRPDGTYAITGTKIFITAGEHDLAENIVHLVLARLPDAPPGVRGISLFLVPKFLLNEDGSPGERNRVECVSIEEKMGIKGVPTCVMGFEGATGFLVGEPNHGLAHMFTMMNHERLAVGLQGLALSETAYQSAARYAKERLQGRSLKGPARPDLPADPIIVHPDVRRMLLTTRAYNEGARALSGWVGLQIDLSEHHPDEEVRRRASDRVALLTPVVKALFTDIGFESCNQCLQVFGGAGYIAETGMEQLVRDGRIAQIYEGTNGIQANDLVTRKLYLHDGRLMREYLEELRGFVAAEAENRELEPFVRPLAGAVEELAAVTEWLKERAAENREELGAAAVDYLRLVGIVSLARMWTEMARVALERAPSDNSGFYEAKLKTGRYFMGRLLPQKDALIEAIRSGADLLMALDAEAY